VSDATPALSDEERVRRLAALATSLVVHARGLGATDEEIRRAVERQLV
jgi:hypothetical protein